MFRFLWGRGAAREGKGGEARLQGCTWKLTRCRSWARAGGGRASEDPLQSGLRPFGAGHGHGRRVGWVARLVSLSTSSVLATTTSNKQAICCHGPSLLDGPSASIGSPSFPARPGRHPAGLGRPSQQLTRPGSRQTQPTLRRPHSQPKPVAASASLCMATAC